MPRKAAALVFVTLLLAISLSGRISTGATYSGDVWVKVVKTDELENDLLDSVEWTFHEVRVYVTTVEPGEENWSELWAREPKYLNLGNWTKLTANKTRDVVCTIGVNQEEICPRVPGWAAEGKLGGTWKVIPKDNVFRWVVPDDYEEGSNGLMGYVRTFIGSRIAW